MPQTIDWFEYDKKEHVIAWALLEAISKVGMDEFEGFDSSALEVQLLVNGVDVDFVCCMNLLQKQLKDIELGGFKRGVEEAAYAINDVVERTLDGLVR